MLRSEHILAQVKQGKLVPHRLTPGDRRIQDVARALISCYTSHLNAARSELERELALLEESLGPTLDPRRGFKVIRALSNLLQTYATWSPSAGAGPYQVRTRIFEIAALLPEPPAVETGLNPGSATGRSQRTFTDKAGALDLPHIPTRDEILAQVAEEMNVEDPAGVMYADRRGAQLLSAFESPSIESLISHYNLAQVQGVFHAAREVTVDLGRAADASLVFRYVKLLQLIYRVERTATGYRIHLEGPPSISGRGRKYGLRLARLLTGLILTGPWELSAIVVWKGREAILELDSASPDLSSDYQEPERVSDEPVLQAFERAWSEFKDTSGWEMRTAQEIILLPGLKTVLIPNFTFENPVKKEQVHLEILGYWTESFLLDRVSQIREARSRGERILIAVSKDCAIIQGPPSEALQSQIIWFKNRLDPQAVLDAINSR